MIGLSLERRSPPPQGPTRPPLLATDGPRAADAHAATRGPSIDRARCVDGRVLTRDPREALTSTGHPPAPQRPDHRDPRAADDRSRPRPSRWRPSRSEQPCDARRSTRARWLADTTRTPGASRAAARPRRTRPRDAASTTTARPTARLAAAPRRRPLLQSQIRRTNRPPTSPPTAIPATCLEARSERTPPARPRPDGGLPSNASHRHPRPPNRSSRANTDREYRLIHG